jgi:Ca2+-binding RTX toxin-like protein
MASIDGTNSDDMLGQRLRGTDEDDTLNGFNGINWYSSSLGNDTFNGGPSTDLIFYSNETGGIKLNNIESSREQISPFSVIKVDGSSDKLNNIENFHATKYDDTLILDSSTTDYVFLEGGNDTVYAASSSQLVLLQEANGSSEISTEGGLEFFPFEHGADVESLSKISVTDGSTYFEPFGVYDDGKLILKAWLLPDNTVRIEKYLEDETKTDKIVSLNGEAVTLSILLNSFDLEKRITVDVDFSSQSISSSQITHLELLVSNGFDLDEYIDKTGLAFDDLEYMKVSAWEKNSEDGQIISAVNSPIKLDAAGANGNDSLIGGRAGDNLSAYAGNDYLEGNAGNDYLDGGSGDDILKGGLGNDTYVYNYLGADTIREEVGEGTDTLRINAEGNSFGDMYFVAGSLFMESSTDHKQNVLKIENPSELEAIIWNWSSVGQANSYTIEGIVSSQAIPTGDEQLYVGTKGADYIQTFASELHVEVYASDGNDEVHLSSSNTSSWVSGGKGADKLYGSSGSDNIRGDYQSYYKGDTASWDDIIYGYDGNDLLYGNQGEDILYGGNGSDFLLGGSGQGHDYLYGEAGVDRLAVNNGTDVMYGGEGDDLFVVQRTTNEAYADIKDHTQGEIIILADQDGGDNPDGFHFPGLPSKDIRTVFDAVAKVTKVFVTQNETEREVASVNGNKAVESITLNDEGYNLVLVESTITQPDLPFTVVGSTNEQISKFDFYLDANSDPGLLGVGDFNLKVNVSPSSFEYISTNFSSEFNGVGNEVDDVISIGAIALNPFTSFNEPMFSLNYNNLNGFETAAVVLSDILVDNEAVEGGSYSINLSGLSINGLVLTRDSSPMDQVAVETDTSTIALKTGNDGRFSLTLSGVEKQLSAALSFSKSESPSIVTSADALDALRLSVGLNTSSGQNDAFALIAADFDQSGKVTSSDALSILKYSVGLTAQQDAKWVFVDTAGDYSDISKSNTSYADGMSIADLSADTSVSLTGILIGDVNDSYSGLIA